VFADTPYANGPFAADPRASNLAVQCAIAEAVTGSELTAAAAIFTPTTSETVVGADTVVASTTFIADLLEASTGSEIISALMAFSSVVGESSVGTDSALVEASTFGATVSESTGALELSSASGVLYAGVTESVVGADQLTRRLLWELIDDSQPVSWQLINTQG
jgi:hypothetical protein